MAKETKAKALKLYDYDKDNKEKNTKNSSKVTKKNSKSQKTNKVIKNNENKEKNTKDEKFSFDEEIIIGLKKIENPKQDNELKKKNNSSKKDTKSGKQKINNKKSVKQKKKLQESSPEQLLIKKKKQAILKLAKWTSLLLIIIGGAIFTILSPIFYVKNIKVEGNSYLSENQIISLSNIELDNNMFKYSKETIIENIKENPYVEEVEVKRKIPDTIKINIVERKTMFMIQFANAYAYISNQGYILEISNKSLNLPILTGYNTPVEELQEGRRLNNEDLKKLGDILKIMESATSNEISNLITMINIEDNDNYKLELKSKNKIVNLGDTTNLSTKMSWIQIFNKLEGNTKGEIMLNMNLNDEKNKPYFRRNVEI